MKHSLIPILIAMLTSLLAGSCRTVTYLPYGEHLTDTVLRVAMQHDSVFMKDSVLVYERLRGDTVFHTRDRWHIEYRDRWHVDTAYHSRADTVRVPYPVEREPRFSEKARPLWLGFISGMGFSVVAAVLLYIRKR